MTRHGSSKKATAVLAVVQSVKSIINEPFYCFSCIIMSRQCPICRPLYISLILQQKKFFSLCKHPLKFRWNAGHIIPDVWHSSDHTGASFVCDVWKKMWDYWYLIQKVHACEGPCLMEFVFSLYKFHLLHSPLCFPVATPTFDSFIIALHFLFKAVEMS